MWGRSLCRTVRRAAASGCSFGLPSSRVGAVFSWPGGVWAATDRTALTDASLTFVGQDLSEFHSLPGTSARGTPFNQVRELAGQDRSVWAATDLGVARAQPADSTVELVDERRGLPDSRVYSIVSRSGRIVVGTAHGMARVSDSMKVERVAPRLQRPRSTPSFPQATRSGSAPGADCCCRCRVPAGWCGRPALISPSFQVAVVRSRLAGRHARRAHPRPAALARSAQPGVDAGAQSVRSARPAPSLRGRRPRLLGGRRSRCRLCPAQHAAGSAAPRRATSRAPCNDLAVDDEFLWVATDGGLVRFRLDAIRP